MATETSNIDDFLMSAHTGTQPAAPEHQPAIEDDSTDSVDDYAIEVEPEKPFQADNAGDDYSHESESENEQEKAPVVDNSEDEYGNKKIPDNEVIRERLARQAESMKRQHQAEIDALRAQIGQPPAQSQQAVADGFEYNPESGQSWDQQLRSFVEQTVSSMTQRQEQAAQQAREQRAHQEFEGKFHQGMANFPDYVDVVGKNPVSDPMLLATRGMKDPAAFFYAASKRMPQELQRIAAIPDAYAQMAEIGRLEATLRQTKASTTAPKPLSRKQEDGQIPHKSEKEPTIEEQIAYANKKKLAQLNLRRGR